MKLFPPSTNADYQGSPWSAAFLALVAILTIVPGGIHFFLPDGGAGVIAGMDLGVHGKQIVGTFAWMGALQIPYGILMLIVALRYRSFTALMLLLQIVEKTLSAVAAWITKGDLQGHHPPENYGVIVALPLLLIFLWLALRPTRQTA